MTMKSLNGNSTNDKRRREENDLSCSIEFNYDGLDDSSLFKGDFGQCLKDAVNNYLRRKILEMFFVFESMTEEERKVLLEKAMFKKSFREIAREIGRDKKTVQSRYFDAILKIKNSPLVNVVDEYKRQED